MYLPTYVCIQVYRYGKYIGMVSIGGTYTTVPAQDMPDCPTYNKYLGAYQPWSTPKEVLLGTYLPTYL